MIFPIWAEGPWRIFLATPKALLIKPILQLIPLISKGLHTRYKYLFSSEAYRRLMKIIPVPLFADNYSYVILNPNNLKAALVDPAEAEEVWKVLAKEFSEYTVTSILLTHKHWDHAGSFRELISKLVAARKSVAKDDIYKIDVYCGANENLEGTTISIKEPTSFELNDFKMKVYPSPCHTRGHCLYQIEDPEGKDNIEEKVYKR